ncbi:MAG: winged helix-turn-helix domain-containing protein [Planctomycetaceae bacterium]
MVSEVLNDELAAIGNVAGTIWQYLESQGPVTLSRLAKEIDAPRDAVMQGVGWLAREGKIRFDETPRSKLIALA